MKLYSYNTETDEITEWDLWGILDFLNESSPDFVDFVSTKYAAQEIKDQYKLVD